MSTHGSLGGCPVPHLHVERSTLSESFVPAGQPDPYLHVREVHEIKEVLSDPEAFLPDNALRAVTSFEPATLRVLARYGFALPEVLASATGQLHRDVRTEVARFFTPPKVRRQEDLVRTLTRNFLDTAPRTGTFDPDLPVFHTVTVALMARLTGLDRADFLAVGLTEEELAQASLDSLELFWGWPDPQRQEELAHRAGRFYRRLRQLVENAADNPDVLYTRLLRHGIDTRRVISLAYFLVIAGQFTTALLQKNVLYSVLTGSHGIELADCVDPERANTAVRAVLATDSSVPTWRRIAGEDVSVGGEPVAPGTEILLELSTRRGGEQGSFSLAFGWGIHRCLGAYLAESETTWVIHEIALWASENRVNLRLENEPRWIDLLSYRAPEPLRIGLYPSPQPVNETR